MKEEIISEIVSNLLENKNPLFVSDKVSYGEILYELKENYEYTPLYNFHYTDNSDLDSLIIDSYCFDLIVFYLPDTPVEEIKEFEKKINRKVCIIDKW